MTRESRTDKHALLVRMLPDERLEVARVTKHATPDVIDVALITIPIGKALRHESLKVAPRFRHQLVVVYIVIPQLVVVQKGALGAAEDYTSITSAWDLASLARDHVVHISCPMSEAIRILQGTSDTTGRL